MRSFGRARSRVVASVVAASAALGVVAATAHAELPGKGFLPNDRAWEQVSPVDKNGYDVGISVGLGGWMTDTLGRKVPGSLPNRAAADGSKLYYATFGPFGDATSGLNVTPPYLATRGEAGWSSHALEDRQHWSGIDTVPYVTEDLTNILLGSGFGDTWLRNTATDEYTLVAPGGAGGGTVGKASADLRSVLCDSGGTLAKCSRDAGSQPEIATVGIDEGGASVGQTQASQMADDGCRVAFVAPFTANAGGPTGLKSDQMPWKVYLRDTCASPAVTTLVSEPLEPCTTDDCTSMLWDASKDLSRVFVTSNQKLTADSTADAVHNDGTGLGGDSWGDLYVYDADPAPGVPHIRDISVDGSNAEGGQVQGVMGASASGDIVYFVAYGQLGTGRGTVGQPNVFRWQDGPGNGTVTYVTTLKYADLSVTFADKPSTVTDGSNYAVGPLTRTSRVTPDGEHLLFTSRRSITGYDNGGRVEAYVYDAEADRVDCASCTGPSPATADVILADPFAYPIQLLTRNLSDDGRFAFFSTREALTPDDTNGRYDVYQYDARERRTSLISSGESDDDSMLLDADRTGHNVFFGTRERLVGQDADGLVDVYDARVGGGLAAQNPAARSTAPCEGDDCQGPLASPPQAPVAASVSFVDDGNVAAPPKRVNASVRVAKPKAVTGSVAKVKVRVPAAGRISVAGAAVRRTGASASKAGTYTVRIALSPRARKTLEKRKTLRASVRVSYRAKDGRTASKRIAITFKQPKAKRATVKKGGR